MGYCANTTECNFRIPADKVPAAFAAAYGGEEEGEPSIYASLVEAIEETTNFHDCCEEDADGFFVLGYHYDKYYDEVERMLATLAPFAVEGSYVRFLGEDDSLFGYRVVDGALRTESGEFTWTLDDLGS